MHPRNEEWREHKTCLSGSHVFASCCEQTARFDRDVQQTVCRPRLTRPTTDKQTPGLAAQSRPTSAHTSERATPSRQLAARPRVCPPPLPRTSFPAPLSSRFLPHAAPAAAAPLHFRRSRAWLIAPTTPSCYTSCVRATCLTEQPRPTAATYTAHTASAAA